MMVRPKKHSVGTSAQLCQQGTISTRIIVLYLYIHSLSDAPVRDRPTLATNTATIRGDPANKDTCPRCGGLVFHAERMLSKNNVSCINRHYTTIKMQGN